MYQQGFDDVARSVDEINAQVNSAITALQFHDMRTQLRECIRKCLSKCNSPKQSPEPDIAIMLEDA